MLQVISGLWEISEVREVRISSGRGEVHFWVVVATGDLDLAERVYQLEVDYYRTGASVGLDTHVIPLDSVDESAIPPSRTLFSRR